MNNKNGYAATVLYRKLNSGFFTMQETKLESFEEELCELKAAGYSVEGIALNDGYLLAVLTKKIGALKR
jgi:hypothetical protein